MLHCRVFFGNPSALSRPASAIPPDSWRLGDLLPFSWFGGSAEPPEIPANRTSGKPQLSAFRLLTVSFQLCTVASSTRRKPNTYNCAQLSTLECAPAKKGEGGGHIPVPGDRRLRAEPLWPCAASTYTSSFAQRPRVCVAVAF